MEYFISGLLGWMASLLQSDLAVNLSRKTKFLIAMGSCLLVSAFVNIVSLMDGGMITLNQILASFGIAFATSQTFYTTYFKDKLEERFKI